jgi:hypothetical protein
MLAGATRRLVEVLGRQQRVLPLSLRRDGELNAESPLSRALGHQEIGRLSREGDVS